MATDKLSWKNESSIQAVSKGADQVRPYHPSLFIMDEAARMDEAEQSFSAALPVCSWNIVVSSTAPGWFAEITSRGREGSQRAVVFKDPVTSCDHL